MYPVELHLFARLLYQERLLAAQRDRRIRQIVRHRPPLYLQLRLWTGERLVRWGNRLMTSYPTTNHHHNIKHSAGTV